MSGERTRLAVHGATGRTGARVIAAALTNPACEVVAALVSPGSASLGQPVPDSPLRYTADLPKVIDAVIDFSKPEASVELVRRCAARALPVVVATTGFTKEQRAEIDALAHDTAVLVAPNCSLVVTLLLDLAARTGGVLKGRGYDVEIVERHHRHKHDAPSGTALRFADVIGRAMGLSGRRHGREGVIGERPADEIGLHAVRGGDNVGEHTVIFAAPGEVLELVHKGTSRDSYATGAVQAALFLAGQKPGRYTMADALGLSGAA